MPAIDQSEAPNFADLYYEQSGHSRYYLIESKKPRRFLGIRGLKIVSLDAT